MDDFWEVLNIEGNLDEAEILFSKIENYCLGSFIEGNLTKIYLSIESKNEVTNVLNNICLLYTSPSPRDRQKSRMPSSA